MAKKTLDILIFVTFLVSCIYGNYFLGTFIDLLAICRGIQVIISERNTFSLQWVKYFLFLPLIFGIKVVLIFLKLTAGANNRRTFFILIPLSSGVENLFQELLNSPKNVSNFSIGL